ncbi:MAG: hypothetical protein L0Y71_22300 [Gemmataceae bacterium]|nr:hypothetical protein [Gemmataceae bacterium]
MKLKLLVLTALSLTGVALSAAPASAWWFCKHGINRYSTVIVCRPYNAFTPVCSGSLVCDGCCPFSCPGLPNGASCSPHLGNPMLGLCYDPAALQAMQPRMPHPAMTMPAAQQFQAPMPAGQQTQMPMSYPVQPAGYQGYYPQAHYPMYYPYAGAYAGQMNPYQQAPAYWYGYGY